MGIPLTGTKGTPGGQKGMESLCKPIARGGWGRKKGKKELGRVVRETSS